MTVAADIHAVTAKWDPDSRDWVARCYHRDCGHLGHCAGVREVDEVRAQHERAHPPVGPREGSGPTPAMARVLGEVYAARCRRDPRWDYDLDVVLAHHESELAQTRADLIRDMAAAVAWVEAIDRHVAAGQGAAATEGGA